MRSRRIREINNKQKQKEFLAALMIDRVPLSPKTKTKLSRKLKPKRAEQQCTLRKNECKRNEKVNHTNTAVAAPMAVTKSPHDSPSFEMPASISRKMLQ